MNPPPRGGFVRVFSPFPFPPVLVDPEI